MVVLGARQVYLLSTDGIVMETLLYRPEAAASALGIGRSKIFQLMAEGQIETVQIGRSRRVPAQALWPRCRAR